MGIDRPPISRGRRTAHSGVSWRSLTPSQSDRCSSISSAKYSSQVYPSIQ